MRTGGAAGLLIALVAVSVLLVGAGNAATASRSPTYSVVDLGTLGGVIADAINNRGDVVGSAAFSGSTSVRAALFRDGRMRDLGTLPGGAYSVGNGLNDNGQVVGISEIPSSPYLPFGHAFLFSGGQMTDLGTLGGNWSQAFDVNNDTVVVGDAYTSDDNLHAFLYSDGTMIDINPAGSNTSVAYGINNSGTVVGLGYFAAGLRGFVWRHGEVTVLGTFGGSGSGANGINDRGDVVGSANLPVNAVGTSYIHAFLYRTGQMLDLGSLAGVDAWSDAKAINSRGQVVGASGTGPGESEYHAFIWDGSAIVDLNDVIPANSGWVLASANGINDRGQITGFGYHNGITRPFLLTPSTGR